MVKKNIKLKLIFCGKKFSKKFQKLLKESEEKASKNSIMQINLALNYGSKEEIIRAVKIIKKNKENINKKILKKIYTPKV